MLLRRMLLQRYITAVTSFALLSIYNCKDRTLEETKQKYEIMEDFTPELEEQLKKEYAMQGIFKDPTSQGMDIEKKF